MYLFERILVDEFKHSNLVEHHHQRVYERCKKWRSQATNRNLLNEAVKNVLNNVKYFFFAHDGPRWYRVNKQTPTHGTKFLLLRVARSESSRQGNDLTSDAVLDEQCAYEKQTAYTLSQRLGHGRWSIAKLCPARIFRHLIATTSSLYFRRHLIV